MALPKVGVQVVAEGAKKATADLASFQKAVTALQGPSSKISGKGFIKANNSLNKLFGSANRGLGILESLNKATLGLIPGLGSFAGAASTATSGMSALTVAGGGLTAALGPLAVALAVAVGAVGALAVGFFALGKRGADIQPSLQAFGNIMSGAGDATLALGNLRKQTRGTISDLELMRLSTAALQGTSAEFRSVVQGDLGVIFDATSRVAAATGQSADVVREKFIFGLRRQSKLLIDDVGVTVDRTSAEFKRLSSEIGEEAAFAQLAIEDLKNVANELGPINTVGEALRRPFVALNNTLDKLALAIQPVFGPLAEAIGYLSSRFEEFMSQILVPASAMFKALGETIRSIQSVAQSLGLAAPFELTLQVLPYVAAAAQMVWETVAYGARLIGQVTSAVASSFRSMLGVVQSDTAFSLSNMASDAGNWAGRIIGSFAAGIANAGTYVVRAVTAIARIVADFLQGFSPPKKGPLSQIDKGGENVAKAWVDGFVSEFSTPIENVASMVNERLGAIGSFGASEVAGRLSSLNEAIQPFVDSLEIAKADYEAIAGYSDEAISALDRQRQKLLESAAKSGLLGTEQLNQLRLLDNQVGALRLLQDENQAITDQAAIQLALMQSQQAQERALLAIQERRVGSTKKLEQALGGAAGQAERAERAVSAASGGGGGGGGNADFAGAGFDLTGGSIPNLFQNDAVARARADILGIIPSAAAGLEQGFDDAGANAAIGRLEGSAGELRAELNRISSSNPVQQLQKRFQGLERILNNPLEALKIASSSATASIVETLASITTIDLSALGSVADGALASLSAAFKTNIESISATINSAFGTEGTITATVSQTFGESGIFSEDGTILTNLTVFKDRLSPLLSQITGVVVFGFYPFTTLSNVIETALNNVAATLLTFVTVGLPSALAGLADSLTTSFVTPFKTAAEAALKALDDAIPDSIEISLGSVDIPVGGAIAGLLGLPSSLPLDFGSATLDLPDTPFQSAVMRAKGGLGVRGLSIVGENGPELVNFKQPTNVFPNDVTRAILSMASEPRFMPISAGGGDTTYNNSNATTNFNVRSPEDAIRIRQRLLARGL